MKQEILNDGSNQIRPDKQRRPAVEVANCSKAFIRRRSGGNNGIIVVVFTRTGLLTSSGTDGVQLGSRGAVVCRLCVCVTMRFMSVFGQGV